MKRPASACVLLITLVLTLGLGPLCPVHADDHGADPAQSCAYCSHLDAGTTVPEVVCATEARGYALGHFTRDHVVHSLCAPRDSRPRGPPHNS